MTYSDYLIDKAKHIDVPQDANNTIIQQIFEDHWHNLVLDEPSLNIRPVVFKEVDKMLSCRKLYNGYAHYSCSHCDNYKIIPFTCKSRFCTSCGIKYALDRADVMSLKAINVKHRHMTFTIPDVLWPVFQKDRQLLNILFDSVAETIFTFFSRLNKKENFKPAFISTLHTFGRDLKWNPHIHVLIAEFGIGNFSSRHITHFPYVMFRKYFQTSLLYALEKKLGKRHFAKIKVQTFKETKNGFYVNAPPKVGRNIKQTVKYVVRYSGRPAIAESRIINYDGQFVTFYYDRHEDNKRVTEVVHAYEFIKRLIIHIPEEGFHIIRYYGIYSKKRSSNDKIVRMVSDSQFIAIKSMANYRWRMITSFNVDPISCSCGHTMHLDYICTNTGIKCFDYFNSA